MRVLAIHFSNAYPEVIKDFRFRTDAEEEKVIDKEMKRIKKMQKKEKQQKQLMAEKKRKLTLPLQPILAKKDPKNYSDADLV